MEAAQPLLQSSARSFVMLNALCLPYKGPKYPNTACRVSILALMLMVWDRYLVIVWVLGR